MKTSNQTVALALSSAFALSIGTATVNAAENPFAIKSLSNGYQVADHHEKTKDGKCGEGKCSAEMKNEAAKAKDGKCGEGKCSAEMKKDAAKAHDGKCGEGKCGAEKAK
ncbi:hypothetical protein [Methylotenera versatilis]|uniref:HvfA family oxazolone/thioamide-modified RiPP metallophore n=1 Tax=Methylotenera versatilis TaxID=1055487 RepID=UPI000647002A|nr:hypothetical protein [Methylotenera versatilis]